MLFYIVDSDICVSTGVTQKHHIVTLYVGYIVHLVKRDRRMSPTTTVCFHLTNLLKTTFK